MLVSTRAIYLTLVPLQTSLQVRVAQGIKPAQHTTSGIPRHILYILTRVANVLTVSCKAFHSHDFVNRPFAANCVLSVVVLLLVCNNVELTSKPFLGLS